METIISNQLNKVSSMQQAYDEIYKFWCDSILSPAHILMIYDKDFRDGNHNLYKWQARTHIEYFHKLKCQEYTSENPLELCIQAVNGSGKDLLVISLFEAFFLMLNKDGVCITTSSSGVQLKNQTEKYIRTLCNKINNYHGFDVFEVKERDIKCNVTNTQLFLFATDEEGKAEGYHPPGPDKPFAIIINEAKSVKPEIFEALHRCTGYQYWIEVSSPGKPVGHFYQMATSTRTVTANGITESAVKFIRVTSDDCPHLGSNYKARIAELYGESHHLYKSMVNCEFASEDEMVVLTYEKYNRALKFQAEWYKDATGNVGGLDLSGGGDEQVLVIRNGNKIIGLESGHIKDAEVLVQTLIKWFIKWNLKDRPIYADAGNMGKTIIDLLHKRGWKNVKYIYNQNTPKDSNAYYNLGTEMWFELATLYENNELCFAELIIRDETLKKQLCGRYFKFNQSVAHLEPKPQARAKGHPSPDRADALSLCFLNYKTPKQVTERNASLKKHRDVEDAKTIKGIPTMRAFVDSESKQFQVKVEFNCGNKVSFKESIPELEKELRQITEKLLTIN